jgi:hypothetical protein
MYLQFPLQSIAGETGASTRNEIELVQISACGGVNSVLVDLKAVAKG